MKQEDWAARVGMSIAREVRRHRLARGMSAQQLSDACSKLGGSIPRTVISNIENQRRTNVSVAEVLLLARALDVPPVALVFPSGYVEDVEFLPGRSADPLSAADWFAGQRLPPGQKDDAWPPGSGILESWPVFLFRQHRNLIEGIFRLRKNAFEYEVMYREGGGTASEALSAKDMANELVSHLSDLRKEIERRGLVPPEIPEVLEKQIQQIEESRGAEDAHDSPRPSGG